ncbi:MAG TPA: hypothetical protein VGL75_00335 [Acidothermaceae bacterium]|jgi:hypothetical protein
MNRAGAINVASNDDPVQSFRDWQRACAIRRVSEARGDDNSDIVRLPGEVIRTRNALTLDRLRAAREVPEDIVRHLTLDDLLLREKDDAGR